MAAHAYFSPSAAHRWMRCPGSVVLAQGVPDEGSAYAREGSAAHDLAARALRDALAAAKGPVPGLSPNAYDQLGRVISIDSDEFVVDADMAEPVQEYLEYVAGLVGRFGMEGAKSVEVRVEQRVGFSHVVQAEDQFGTADTQIIAYWPDGAATIATVDLKYGRGQEVAAEENEQLLLYTLGTVDEIELVCPVREVLLVVHQPRRNHVDEWATTSEHVQRFAAQAREAADRVRQAQTCAEVDARHLNPGDKQCRWCPAKAECPALREHALSTILGDFAEDETQPLAAQVEECVAAVGNISSNEVLGRLMGAADLIEDWIKAVRAKVESELCEGRAVPGFKLVQGRRGARQWSDAAAVEQALKTMRLKLEQMYDLKLISPTTAEKLAKAKGSDKPVLGPRQWTRLQDLITQPEGRPHVALADDPRPPVTVHATVEEFDDIT